MDNRERMRAEHNEGLWTQVVLTWGTLDTVREEERFLLCHFLKSGFPWGFRPIHGVNGEDEVYAMSTLLSAYDREKPLDKASCERAASELVCGWWFEGEEDA